MNEVIWVAVKISSKDHWEKGSRMLFLILGPQSAEFAKDANVNAKIIGYEKCFYIHLNLSTISWKMTIKK